MLGNSLYSDLQEDVSLHQEIPQQQVVTADVGEVDLDSGAAMAPSKVAKREETSVKDTTEDTAEDTAEGSALPVVDTEGATHSFEERAL